MFFMGCKIFGINEDIIQIDNNTYVQHIHKNAIDKALESGQSISESFRHNQPLIRAIVPLESSFPLISFHYPDKMIGRMEVYFGVILAWRV
jgi:hypothetical protein